MTGKIGAHPSILSLTKNIESLHENAICDSEYHPQSTDRDTQNHGQKLNDGAGVDSFVQGELAVCVVVEVIHHELHGFKGLGGEAGRSTCGLLSGAAHHGHGDQNYAGEHMVLSSAVWCLVAELWEYPRVDSVCFDSRSKPMRAL
ncbi:hypothetical protein RRG08_060086 [Elysia crispata]|uniref:Uncharacterized protein n=1 Tax=Elysia crispata TaxID=231223 RepID=A0AAE1ADD8_9GAST|nr:hypothetical protein RRG08_060086 [Elysia crispata]